MLTFITFVRESLQVVFGYGRREVRTGVRFTSFEVNLTPVRPLL